MLLFLKQVAFSNVSYRQLAKKSRSQMLRVKIMGKLPKIPKSISQTVQQTPGDPRENPPTRHPPNSSGEEKTKQTSSVSKTSMGNCRCDSMETPWGPHHDQIKEGICLNRLPEVVVFSQGFYELVVFVDVLM